MRRFETISTVLLQKREEQLEQIAVMNAQGWRLVSVVPLKGEVREAFFEREVGGEAIFTP